MKVLIRSKKRNRKRPATPTVALTDDAYDALIELSGFYDTSMRELASAIIVSAYQNIENIDIEKEDNLHECNRQKKGAYDQA